MVKVKMNQAGVRELLRSPEIVAELKRRADAIAAAAGDGMEVDQELGRNRARASVRTATFEAVIAESKDRALTEAIDAGRM